VRHVGVIAGRELRSMFSTPVAYAALTVYAILAGFVFFLMLGLFFQDLERIQLTQAYSYLAVYNLNQAVIGPWLGTFGVLFLLIVPVLSMRTFAGEREHGTIELLLTSPLTAGEIVVGKYLAVLALLSVILLLTAVYPALLFLYGDPEPLQTLAGMISLFLYGAALAAIGCFVSSLTQSQLLAALVTVVIGVALLLIDKVAFAGVSGTALAVARYLGTEPHLTNGLVGKMYGEDIVYFSSIVVLFLFLTRHSVEWLRWR